MNKQYQLTKLEQFVATHPNMTWEQIAKENNTSVYRATKSYDNIIIKSAKAAALKWLNEQRDRNGVPPLQKLDRQWWAIYGLDWRQKIINLGDKGIALLANVEEIS
jgi:hypothetical protein